MVSTEKDIWREVGSNVRFWMKPSVTMSRLRSGSIIVERLLRISPFHSLGIGVDVGF